MKKWILLTPFVLFLSSCLNKRFDSVKWKTEEKEQYYMLKDIVENERLLGKSKHEIIEMLDTTNIKQFKYSDDSWMYIILIPNAKATQSPVKNMYIEFENEKVKAIEVEN